MMFSSGWIGNRKDRNEGGLVYRITDRTVVSPLAEVDKRTTEIERVQYYCTRLPDEPSASSTAHFVVILVIHNLGSAFEQVFMLGR